MKMIKLLILFVPFVILLSCKKEDTPTPIPITYTGTATALKNGEEWENKITFSDNSPFNNNPLILAMVSQTDDKNGLVIETWALVSIRPIFGKQFIKGSWETCPLNCPLDVRLTTWIDGDVPNNRYVIDSTEFNNLIQIIKYDSIKQEIIGEFSMKLKLIREGNGNPTGEEPPQTLEFTNGKFTTKVKKEWFE